MIEILSTERREPSTGRPLEARAIRASLDFLSLFFPYHPARMIYSEYLYGLWQVRSHDLEGVEEAIFSGVHPFPVAAAFFLLIAHKISMEPVVEG
ncbi:MAG: hypothetical protein M1290_02255 [Candidatus Thermoplasmatota archaeon]|nr:hypothetical protein [Candidatus Thermoplasmatota archaeon]MCL5789269.1 hypothetical protein [Candidatus Thermoplasmatota archaeon]